MSIKNELQAAMNKRFSMAAQEWGNKPSFQKAFQGVNPENVYRFLKEMQYAETSGIPNASNPMQIKQALIDEMFGGRWGSKVDALGLTQQNVTSAEKAPQAALLGLLIQLNNLKRRNPGVPLNIATPQNRARIWDVFYNTASDPSGSKYYMNKISDLPWI